MTSILNSRGFTAWKNGRNPCQRMCRWVLQGRLSGSRSPAGFAGRFRQVFRKTNQATNFVISAAKAEAQPTELFFDLPGYDGR